MTFLEPILQNEEELRQMAEKLGLSADFFLSTGPKAPVHPKRRSKP